MHIEEFRTYCLKKKGVTEEFPFDNETLVFKVLGKMFALANVESFESINLKCDPEEAILLRERYSSILPGYHMSKKHWNTILMEGEVDDRLLTKMIDDSYQLVAKGLTKANRKTLGID